MDANNAGQDIDSAYENAKKEYLDFLDDAVDLGINSTRIKDMVDAKSNRVELDVNYLRTKNLERSRQLLENANMEMAAFQDALRDLMANKYPDYSQKFEEFYIGLVGAFGFRHCSPRTINAKFLGGLVCVEGIVTKASLIHPKILRSVHFCPKTGKTLERRYADLTTYNAVPSSTAYPTKDDEGNLLETEYGMCVYKDHQTVYLQELPEKSPAGQLPRSVEVIMDGDLVDAVKPGDRVLCVGVFKPMPSKKQGYTSGNFKTIIVANNVIHVDIKDDTVQYSAEDIEIMRKVCKKHANDSKSEDIIKILTKSVAPSIYGLEHEKEALLCMLVGGNETVLPNGTRLRGDINIMLVGDPSVAKSQLLRYVVQVAPRAVTTTGRGSSGVGLTAAVTNDSETGDRRLEAGAMVLADRGVVCIDEFDKMTELDRTAIHEVMEQGRVTIAKAGIHAQLNARCSVLAAANPIYGKYNPYRSPMENIAMPDSLLSRFDLIFIMTDKIDAEEDGIIAGHVLNMHRYRDPKEREGQASNFDQLADWLSTRQLQDKEAETNNNFGGGAARNNNARDNVYEKENVLLQPPTKSGVTTRAKADKLFSKRFMKMFIGSARATRPELTVEACDYIAEAYAHLRSEESAGDEARTQVVTVRALETMIRLTIAYAKLHLSKKAKIEHAQAADELVQYAYFRKVEKKPRKPKAVTTNGKTAEADDAETDEEVEDETAMDAGVPTAAKTNGKHNHEGADMEEDDDEDEEDEDVVRLTKKRRGDLNGTVEGQNNVRTRSGAAKSRQAAASIPGTPATASVSRDRLRQVQAAVVDAFASRGSGSIQQTALTDHVKESVPFATDDEISQAFEIMHQQNKIMIADDFVFKV